MDHISVIRTEADRFADVLGDANPAARCPTCPDWSAADLLWHLTEVHLFWAGILGSGATTEDDVASVEAEKPARPDSVADLLSLRRQATDSLLDQLARLDDAEPRWSWWEPDQTVGFTRRTQTYEATFHRVDAELTAGVPVGPIITDVAAGAIDRCVDVEWAWKPDWAAYEPLTAAVFRATDTGQEWTVEVGHWYGTGHDSGKSFDEPRAVRAVDRAAPDVPTDVIVTADAEQLARWAWKRGGQVRTDGTPDGLTTLDALVTTGIQ